MGSYRHALRPCWADRSPAELRPDVSAVLAQTPCTGGASGAAAPPMAWLRGPLATASLGLADLEKHLALRHYGLFRFMAATPPGALERLGPLAAWRAADQARRRVPAYRTLLARSGWRDDPRLPVVEWLRRLPVMDKESYLQAFSTEERCLDGRIPAGSMIDESVGSSGTPYNWVGSAGELRGLHRQTLVLLLCHAIGGGPAWPVILAQSSPAGRVRR